MIISFKWLRSRSGARCTRSRADRMRLAGSRRVSQPSESRAARGGLGDGRRLGRQPRRPAAATRSGLTTPDIYDAETKIPRVSKSV